MGVPRVPRLSGIQREVLALYREFLRVARVKSGEDREQLVHLVSSEFRRNSKEVDRKNFECIEHLIRQGRKQLDQLKSPDTTGFSSIKVNVSSTTQTKHS
ncbi:OLC1v1018492C1 [Oldenlandia corymbosa var. corymbosa]|uniref:OLC1v1018492C1 n=1 Tax=Oldenlandia corymbosa var. corymbosa TaxID=529605 RepID=A0AAV1EBR0_OLDCO|nr:OLC1v1018492C1 [Oldenlandia corymbosa var. corymbosa]